MASSLTAILRCLPLRRRYALFGLIACFIVCLLIYSTVPPQSHQLVRQSVAQKDNQGTRSGDIWSVKKINPHKLVKDWISPNTAKPSPLSSILRFPYEFNISAERLGRLRSNTMLFRQLSKEVSDTRAYLFSVQPDFDVNAGSCRCGHSISSECSCCARLTMKRFYMERPGCVNFTYVLKEHQLRVRLSYNARLIAAKSIPADRPPMLCAGREMELCAAFRNVSYRVQLDSPDHKTTLSGCLDLLLRLSETPIAIYPLGCFRTGRDPKLVHIDKVNNWVP